MTKQGKQNESHTPNHSNTQSLRQDILETIKFRTKQALRSTFELFCYLGAVACFIGLLALFSQCSNLSDSVNTPIRGNSAAGTHASNVPLSLLNQLMD